MSKERYRLFSNGTEFMQWQERNCEECIKAVFYDEKKDRWPKYRCAVQKHIEEAAVTDGMGNKRDFDATRSDCPYKQTACWNNAHDFRPKHLQRCICYDKYMGGVYCYVYDDISKYWCTQTTEEHDSDGDNHISDYADYRITLWMPLPNTSFYPSKSRFDKQREQKSTWSEEDERNLKCIMKIIKEKAFADYDIDEDNNMLGIYGILENWMKSLKQRME